MTKLIPALLTGLLALGLTIAHGSGKSGRTASNAPITGTATAVHPHSTGTALILRVSGNRLVDITVPAHAGVKTANGTAMTASVILLGDRLTVSRTGAVQDLSQRLTTVKGIVSVAPLGGGDPLVVQQSSTSALLIDLSVHTRYSDTSHETARLEQLEDADQVQVRGLLDGLRGEMTRTDSVTRTGPVHKKSGGASA